MENEAPPGAQAAETQFDNLWNAGAFNQSGTPDPEQGQTGAVESKAEPKAAAEPEPTKEPVKAEADPKAEKEEEVEYANLEDYLQKAGLEREAFLKLPARIKVDGAESDVPLAEVLKSYQLEKHVQAKSIAVAEQQKAWEAQKAQEAQALQQSLKNAETLATLAHQQLLAEYQGVDWNTLRFQNPAEWAAKSQEFNLKAAQIQQHLQNIQSAQSQQQQEQQQKLLAEIPKQRERMYEARPEWRDSAKFQAARSEMTSYAKQLGYTEAEIQGITDHRAMLVLHDAARYAQLQAQAPSRLKQVRAAPQIAAPGARITRDPKQVALTQAKERWAKNPRDQDAAVAVFDQFA